jgi:acyl carrier protein
MEQIVQQLTDYFQDMYDTELGRQENIFNSGIIDSLGFVNLIEFIRERYDIALEPEDLVEDNFESFERIAAFILEKKQ